MSLKGLFNTRWPGVALFDLDGTLIDSVPDIAAAVDQTLQQLGRSAAGQDAVRQWVGNGSAVLVRRALAGQRNWESADPKKQELFNDALKIFYSNYEKVNGEQSVVYHGVRECLAHLSANKCRMAVVTNKPHRFVAPLLEKMKLAQWFQLTLGGDSLPTLKPDPQPLLHAMGELKGTRGTTVMVGDSVTDVNAAQAAGIPIIAVRYGYNAGPRLETLGPQAVVDSLIELL